MVTVPSCNDSLTRYFKKISWVILNFVYNIKAINHFYRKCIVLKVHKARQENIRCFHLQYFLWSFSLLLQHYSLEGKGVSVGFFLPSKTSLTWNSICAFLNCCHNSYRCTGLSCKMQSHYEFPHCSGSLLSQLRAVYSNTNFCIDDHS